MSYEITTIHHTCDGQLENMFANEPSEEDAEDPLLWHHGNQEGFRHCPYCGGVLPVTWNAAMLAALDDLLGLRHPEVHGVLTALMTLRPELESRSTPTAEKTP